MANCECECRGDICLEFESSSDICLEFEGLSDEFIARAGEIYPVQTSNYEELNNKPSIEGVTLLGNKTFPQLGLGTLTAQEIDELLFGGE